MIMSTFDNTQTEYIYSFFGENEFDYFPIVLMEFITDLNSKNKKIQCAKLHARPLTLYGNLIC